MGACGGGGSNTTGGATNNAASGAGAEAPKNTNQPAAKSGTTPKWVTEVAAKPVTAKVGDMVWAVVYKDDTPAGNYAPVFGTFKVEAVNGNTATLSRESPRESFTNIPGALIHPIPDKASIKVGDIATVSSGIFPTIGRVTKVESGKVTAKYVEGAFMETTPVQEKVVQESYAVASGIEPLAWVAFDDGGRNQKGLCVGVDGETVYVIKSGNNDFFKVEKSKVKPLAIGRKDFKAGDAVMAYEPLVLGYEPATIKEVVQPGLVYKAENTRDKRVKSYFFADLAEKF
jgi:hypothetical protein